MRITRKTLHYIQYYSFFLFAVCSYSLFCFDSAWTFFSYLVSRFLFLFHYSLYLCIIIIFSFFYYETNCNEAMIFIVCAVLIVGQSISNTTDYISFTTVLFVFFCDISSIKCHRDQGLFYYYHRSAFEIRACCVTRRN